MFEVQACYSNLLLWQVIYDKETGRSRGFGFVTMSTVEEVEAAAQQFNGYVGIRDRVLFVVLYVLLFNQSGCSSCEAVRVG